jgi:hypothetical protein
LLFHPPKNVKRLRILIRAYNKERNAQFSAI